MKEARIHLLFGLTISLQQFISFFENQNLGFLFYLIALLFIHLSLLRERKYFIKSIYIKSSFNLILKLYLCSIILSVLYFIENDIFRWITGLTPIMFTFFFIRISYSSDIDKNINNAKKIWEGMSFGSLIVLTIVLIFGNYTDSVDRLTLGSISASTIGRNAILIICFTLSNLLFNIKSNKKINFFMLFIAIISLLLSTSKSSILALLIILLLLAFKMKLISVKSIITVAVSIISLLFLPVFGTFMNGLNKYFEKNQTETLSGRTQIWTFLGELIDKQFWLGYGYNSPSLLLTQKYFNIWDGRDVIQAHNAWLQSLLNVGFIGTLILTILLFVTFFEINKLLSLNKQLYFILTFILLFLFIRGFSEASFANGCSLDVYIFFIIIFQILFLNISKTKNYKRNKLTLK